MMAILHVAPDFATFGQQAEVIGYFIIMVVETIVEYKINPSSTHAAL
jgi:hypothetical protein